MATYKIHPGIGIARLGNSTSEFYLAPETPAGVPQQCDEYGNPRSGADGITPLLVTSYKDAEGRIKRQGARFQVYVYDAETPQGRPLKLGDPVEGGGNTGVLVDIRWRVYLANKKASWYQFNTTDGEHGYAPGTPRRNPAVTGSDRDSLIIDPGPRVVNITNKRRASFDRSGEGDYATTFPPPDLQPFSIDTLGEMVTDNAGRLIVLGGHGHAGTAAPNGAQTGDYANHDGWFDDTSDGPVTARLVMYCKDVTSLRYVDVEYPAWVMVGYPRYVPQILDMVTLDDVIQDLSLRQFASDTALYGTLDTFDDPQPVNAHNPGQLSHWLASRLTWNRDYRPWFFRDVWPILYRPDEFRWLTDILGQSNFPHDQQKRGTFDPDKLCIPPVYFATRTQRDAARTAAESELRKNAAQGEAAFETAKLDDNTPDPKGRWAYDPYWPMRNFLFDLLRLPGEENDFKVAGRITSRIYNLPLMPLLCGDNPLINTAPVSKFLRLTDHQLFILRQWAAGLFIDDRARGWTPPDYSPYEPYPTTPPANGRELDRGVLTNVLGGAFCPGGEVGWIVRNPSAYWEPYRIKADRTISDFFLSAAQCNATQSGGLPNGNDLADFTFSVEDPLSQDNNFAAGQQPGDLTKYMALPWHTDFNECTTQPIDITYASWNVLYPDNGNDTRLATQQKVWETLWWPAHRPMQVWENIGGALRQLDWSRGIQQTNTGDIKMVSEWWKLPFVIPNPALKPADFKKPSSDLGAVKFVGAERS